MPPGVQVKGIRENLQRVEIGANEVEMVLEKGAFDPRMYRMNHQIDREERIIEKGDSLILKILVRLRTRGGEKIIQVPGGGDPSRESKLDQALIRSMARAFEWREALENGEAKSILELARRANCDEHYIRRLLKLAFLSPKIIEAILKGNQPRGVTLSHILRSDLPLSWDSQHGILGFIANS